MKKNRLSLLSLRVMIPAMLSLSSCLVVLPSIFAQEALGGTVKNLEQKNAENSLVDILVVIDDSGSMIEEQLQLSKKLLPLVSALENVSWRIGVITTSVKSHDGRDACNLTLIKSDDDTAEAKFARAIYAGVNGDSNEQGIRQAVNGLRCPENPWVRPGSKVAVVIVSDEDNCSANGNDCPNTASNDESFLINYVEQELQREIGKDAGFYGIFSLPSNPCRTARNVATQYQRLVDYKATEFSGAGNICDSDYGSTLSSISKEIAGLLRY